MEGGREGGSGGGAPMTTAGQERRRRWCGDDEEESSHGSSGVELSLRLRTGAAADDDDGAASAPPRLAMTPAAVEARRNMTIFYNGRVCAVDVTEVQARAIISMASEETLAAAGHRRRQDGDGDSSSTAAVARRCARGDRGLVIRQAGGFAGGDAVAAPVVEIDPAVPTGLSMKRSLQLFLQKRKARTAAAGGGRQAQAVRG